MANAATQPVVTEVCRCVYVDNRLSEDLAGVEIENAASGGFRNAVVPREDPGNDITSKIDRQIGELNSNISALLNEFERSKWSHPG